MGDAARTISITEARKRIFEIADEAQFGGHFTLTEKGRPRLVMMSAEEYEGWLETLEIMSEDPNIVKELELARKEAREGKVIPLEEIMKEYGVPRRARKKSKKATQ